MRKIVNIFLPINLNVCFGCSKEPSHWDSSFEYPQLMFWMRNKENKFPICTPIWRPAYNKRVITLILVNIAQFWNINKCLQASILRSGFPQALEIMENL